MDTNAEIKEFKVCYTKKTLFIIFFGILLFTLAGLVFILKADMFAADANFSSESNWFADVLFYKILGWVDLCFFTILGSVAYFKFSKSPWLFTVNEKGIILPEGFVEWESVARVYLYEMKGTVLLRINVKSNAAEYLKRNYSRFQKFLALVQEKNTFSYPVSGTNVDIHELYEFMRSHLKKCSKKTSV